MSTGSCILCDWKNLSSTAKACSRYSVVRANGSLCIFFLFPHHFDVSFVLCLFLVHILLEKDHFVNGLISPATGALVHFFLAHIIRIDVSFIFFTALHHHKIRIRWIWLRRHAAVSHWSLCFFLSLRRTSISISDRSSNKICIWIHLNRNHNFFPFRLYFISYWIFFFSSSLFLHHSHELTLRKRMETKCYRKLKKGEEK